MKRLFVVALCTGALILACTDGPPTPTGTVIPELPTAAQENPSAATESANAPIVDNLPPAQAVGELIIEGNYGRCIQTTNYPRNLMSTFRVHEDGSQTLVSRFESGEGVLPCGYETQVDCTVRDTVPIHGAISAYDLYASFIGRLLCEPPSKPECQDPAGCGPGRCEPTEDPSNKDQACIWDPRTCEYRCEPERCDEPTSPDNTSEDCIWNPETCRFDCEPPEECELPGPGAEQFSGGNPWPSPTAECNNFGLVPGPGGFYITKCGLHFQWGYDYPATHCTNGQEVSHVTECGCPEEL